jgi:hypothetical protein
MESSILPDFPFLTVFLKKKEFIPTNSGRDVSVYHNPKIMKLSSLKFIFLLFLNALVISACQDNETVYADLKDLSPEARKFFGLQGSMQRTTQAAGNSGSSMINKSFGAARSDNPSLSISTETSSDSTLVPEDRLPWVTCAVVTQTENPDGSITYITDYGDGCIEGSGDYQYLMHGKLTSTYKYTNAFEGSVYVNDYFSRTKMENYGGSYFYNGDTSSWLNNGSSTYSGSSSYDTADQTFSGNYTWSDSSKYGYGRDTYVTNSSGNVVYNEKKSVTSASHYEYSIGAEYYSTTVIVPLVMDYSCRSNFVSKSEDLMRCVMPSTYVSGRERIEYNRDGVSGSFEIDYGDGACDTVITIYENGKIFKIDVFADYERVMTDTSVSASGG